MNPKPDLTLTAQTPFPHSLSNEMDERLQLVCKTTAHRSTKMINALLASFDSHLKKDKTDEWRKHALHQIDQIRYQSFDGIQAQFAAQHISLEEQNHLAKKINTKGVAAKKALLSNPSPLLGAFNFVPHLKEFIADVKENQRKMDAFSQVETPKPEIAIHPITPKNA